MSVSRYYEHFEGALDRKKREIHEEEDERIRLEKVKEFKKQKEGEKETTNQPEDCQWSKSEQDEYKEGQPESGERMEVLKNEAMEPVDGDSVEPTGVRNLRMLRSRMEVERLEVIRLMEERK